MNNNHITVEKLLKKIKMEVDLLGSGFKEDEIWGYRNKRQDFLALLELLKRFNYKSQMCEDCEYFIDDENYSLLKEDQEVDVNISEEEGILYVNIYNTNGNFITGYNLYSNKPDLLEIRIKYNLFTREEKEKIRSIVSDFISKKNLIIRKFI